MIFLSSERTWLFAVWSSEAPMGLMRLLFARRPAAHALTCSRSE